MLENKIFNLRILLKIILQSYILNIINILKTNNIQKTEMYRNCVCLYSVINNTSIPGWKEFKLPTAIANTLPR